MWREIGDEYIFDASSLSIGTHTCCPQGGSSGSESGQPMNTANVWEFVQLSRRLPIPDNEIVTDYRQQYRREALWVSRILERATPYVGHIVALLDERYMPVELALLPAIESGYQSDVHSAEDAAGLWQIVPETARDIGITQTAWFDGRSDLVESTTAALNYLAWLNAEFHGDWLLTLAAYNAGPGRVRAAMQRNRDRGLSRDFWSLSLPRETRQYVPKFLALVAMLRHDSPALLSIPETTRGNGFEVLEFPHRVSIDRIAAVAGMPADRLRRLNAGLVHGVTPPDGPHHVYIGKPEADQLIQAVTRSSQQDLYAGPASHVVEAGDSISTIAERHGVSVKALMEMNELDGTLIRIGQRLAVRFSGDSESESVEYIVTIGDTLSQIARRYSVGMGQIRDEHGAQLEGDVIHPGERLSIQMELEPAG